MWKDTTVLIDIEGTDGSGKETQSKLLQEVLQRRGLAVGLLHFPQYGTPSASIIEKYLSGGYGENPSAVNPRAASMMYALDRFDAFNAVDSRLNTRPLDVIILDRYTYSNIIHQCSKLPVSEQDSFATWLCDLEFYALGLPRPDLVVFLDADTSATKNVLAGREVKDGVLHDIHEKDVSYLSKSRETGLRMAKRFNWRIIPVLRGSAYRNRQDILRDILECVDTELHLGK